MLSSFLILLICVFGVALGDLLRKEQVLVNGTLGRELQNFGWQVPNNCATVFPGNAKVRGLTCTAPCNNPCALLSTTGNGCAVNQYCVCEAGKKSKPNVVKCLNCPYITAKGTTCPGDGFVYDKSLSPAPAKAPSGPPVKLAPKCYGRSWGTCVMGEYCRQKAELSFECTPCLTGLICSGDGTRFSPPPPPSPVRGPK